MNKEGAVLLNYRIAIGEGGRSAKRLKQLFELCGSESLVTTEENAYVIRTTTDTACLLGAIPWVAGVSVYREWAIEAVLEDDIKTRVRKFAFMQRLKNTTDRPPEFWVRVSSALDVEELFALMDSWREDWRLHV